MKWCLGSRGVSLPCKTEMACGDIPGVVLTDPVVSVHSPPYTSISRQEVENKLKKNMVVADVVDQKAKRRKRLVLFLGGSTVLVILLAVVIGIAVTNNRRNNRLNSNSNNNNNNNNGRGDLEMMPSVSMVPSSAPS